MERYLVYDSACSACNHLAHEIESLAGAKLYFEMRRDGRSVDPMPWLRR